ncbi:MAG: hypothetical protein CVU50_02290 [Candidatus Cloacimonetes bacterium HGW-Cloacimonetes-3]|jgi:hypothetical protein|nr:MAG: hypothetical protein CVU50_02290 [Candidatus Cloacimonetes bacterium HGW-Cloacimonetes-3]
MFKLDEKHLEAAQLIAKEHRRKKSCDACYDRGWIGVSEQNLLVLCTRCVEMDAAMEAWKAYVSEHEDLKEHFSELFEEKPVEESTEAVSKPTLHDHHKTGPTGKPLFTPGQRRTGHTKKIG